MKKVPVLPLWALRTAFCAAFIWGEPGYAAAYRFQISLFVVQMAQNDTPEVGDGGLRSRGVLGARVAVKGLYGSVGRIQRGSAFGHVHSQVRP